MTRRHADLWQMEDFRKATPLGDAVEAAYRTRTQSLVPTDPDAEEQGPATRVADNGKHLVLALYSTFRRHFWISGVLKLVGDALTVTSPLVSQALLLYLTQAYAHARLPNVAPDPGSVGRGFGLAIALFLMQCEFALCGCRASLRTQALRQCASRIILSYRSSTLR